MIGIGLALALVLALAPAAAADSPSGSAAKSSAEKPSAEPTDGGTSTGQPEAPKPASAKPDAGSDAGASPPDGGTASALLPIPPLHEPPAAASASAHKRGKAKGGKSKGGGYDVMLESQNHLQGVARRYAQLLLSRRFDEARLLHEEEGGRRPDWTSVRTAAANFLDAHGAPQGIDQSLTTYHGSELTTFFFTAHFSDGSELPMRVAVDHWGHISGAGVGGDVVPALKKRYERHDEYKTRTELSLPFSGTWMASNATLAPGNGHYLNANQRFAIDFFIVEETEPGKRKSHRDSGRQNSDYFSYGQDVLAPASGVVIQVVDGVPDNSPGQTDVYYRLGNSVVLSFENGEFAYLCHLMTGSIRVRPGDRVQRGQVLAKCGNSGNSTGPHLHFQLTDGPLISHSASLPAWFRNVRRNGALVPEALPQSGERFENIPPNLRAQSDSDAAPAAEQAPPVLAEEHPASRRSKRKAAQ